MATTTEPARPLLSRPGPITFREAVRTAPAAGVLLVATGAALWGIDIALRQPLVDTWSSYTIVFYEHVLLTAFVLPYVILHWRDLRGVSAGAVVGILFVAWGGSAIATLAFTEAFRVAFESGGQALVVVLLQKTQPLWAILAAVIVVNERPSWRIVYYIVPALIGGYLLSFGWMAPNDAIHDAAARAVVLALVAAALWGSATAVGRRVLREVRPGLLTGLRFSVALPLLAVIAAWKSDLAPPSGVSAGDWWRIFLVALLPGLIAIILYYRGLRTTPAPVATIAELAFPASTLVVGYVFLDEHLQGWQLVGLAIIVVTIALIHRVPVRVPEPREPVPTATPALARGT